MASDVEKRGNYQWRMIWGFGETAVSDMAVGAT